MTPPDPDRAFNDDPRTGSFKLPKQFIWPLVGFALGAGGSAGVGGFIGSSDKQADAQVVQMAKDVNETKGDVKTLVGTVNASAMSNALTFQRIDNDVANLRKEVEDVRKRVERRR